MLDSGRCVSLALNADSRAQSPEARTRRLGCCTTPRLQRRKLMGLESSAGSVSRSSKYTKGPALKSPKLSGGAQPGVPVWPGGTEPGGRPGREPRTELVWWGDSHFSPRGADSRTVEGAGRPPSPQRGDPCRGEGTQSQNSLGGAERNRKGSSRGRAPSRFVAERPGARRSSLCRSCGRLPSESSRAGGAEKSDTKAGG